jgi:AraC-like DNA-binding protein/Tfp pilus assembly protein PilF
MKNLIFIFIFSITTNVTGGQNNTIHLGFKQLPLQQLLDTANHYYDKSSFDTALLCYSLIINATVKDTNLKQQGRVVDAYNRSANIYREMSDFRTAYEFYLKALHLCEKYDFMSFKPKIYNNIGVIYYDFNEFNIAKSYFFKALDLNRRDSILEQIVFSNLGTIEMKVGNMDSAFYFTNKAIQISVKRLDSLNLHMMLNVLALSHQKIKQYDSAFYYFRLTLNDAEKSNSIDRQAHYLSLISKLFFEIRKIDSALFYVNLSNTIAKTHNLNGILAENYLTLSQIEDLKNNKTKAFEYFKKHTALKDSIFNTSILANINQLQHLHEASKINQQIEQLTIEQHIKNRTIYYQRVIQHVILATLLLVSGFLIFVFFQKRKLSTAYNVLFEKNIKIIELQECPPGAHLGKYQKSPLTDEMQNELLIRIYALMEDVSIVCDTQFSLDKLASMVQSNRVYVSQVINDVLKKNFRTFVNEYRIQEAQRLFSELDTSLYTIEFISLKTGFKSRTSFIAAFKEITGVSPSFYLNSMQKTAKN